MKYLKLRVSTEDRGLLYEKDVEVRNAFESFIRNTVSGLVRDGTIKEGEHYCAIVAPRYGDHLRRDPILVVDAGKVAEKTDWIEMNFEEPLQPETPVRYFTIEFRIRERNLIYRRDYQPLDVGSFYVAYGIEQALVNLGVLAQGEYYFPRFFARDDDDAQFDKERIPALESQASSLVEFISPEPIRSAFAFRNPDVYGEVETVGNLSADDVRIYIRRDAMEGIVAEAKRAAEVECGGVLVGQVYGVADGGRPIVEVSDFIVSEHTASSVMELHYTFESWQASTAKLRERFPGKRIVGWYHTHLVGLPFYTDATCTKTELTKLFFSRDDLFLHRQFFADEWYVAMVLDPEGKSVFFEWKNGQVVACGGYHIFEETGVAGQTEGPNEQ